MTFSKSLGLDFESSSTTTHPGVGVGRESGEAHKAVHHPPLTKAAWLIALLCRYGMASDASSYGGFGTDSASSLSSSSDDSD